MGSLPVRLLSTVMRGERAAALRQRHARRAAGTRPPFIDEPSWNAFVAHVLEGKSMRDIAHDFGLSTPTIEVTVLRVARTLEMPRPEEAWSGAIGLDSPIEDLALSGRARNALRKAGCSTIRSLVEMDFRRAVRRLGPITRDEILAALRRHGFETPPAVTEETSRSIAEVKQEILRLRSQIAAATRQWRNRLERIEIRIRRLQGQPEQI